MAKSVWQNRRHVPMTVLFLSISTIGPSLSRARGVRLHAERANWKLQTLEFCQKSTAPTYRFVRSPGGSDLASVLDFWKPDGCIVDCDAIIPIPPAWFGAIPVVYIDPGRADLGSSVPVVRSDGQAIARAAARELLLSGFREFAFVDMPGRPTPDWSRRRGDAFRGLVEDSGAQCAHRLSVAASAKNIAALRDALLDWLPTLPRPCGIFAANDIVGETVLAACGKLGLRVPDEMAVVAVDNLEIICENTQPTLSSVELDLVGAGAVAAAWLDERMRKPSSPVGATRLYGAAGVVRRGSTLFLRNGDRRVLRAVEYIRRHACDGAIPADVFREMGISRAMANRVFRRATGHTILDEILAVRLDRAKGLLARGTGIAAVSDQCGFGSLANFRLAFRRRVGTPVGAWTRTNRAT